MNLWERHKEERRRQILEAARGLIRSGGVESLAMRELAVRAGVSVATLYNLYGSKMDILFALLGEALDEQEEALARRAPSDPLERAIAVVRISIDQFARDPELYRPAMRALLSAKEAVGLPAAVRRCVDIQATSVAQGVARGLLARDLDGSLVAYQMLLSYVGALDLWAQGVVDIAGFRAHALHGLLLCVLAAATPAARPRVVRLLRSAERELGAVDRLWATQPAAKLAVSALRGRRRRVKR